MADTRIKDIATEITNPNSSDPSNTYFATDHSTNGYRKISEENVKKLITENWSDPKGGYILGGVDDRLPIDAQTGIKSLALTVILDSVSSVALGTLGTNLEIQVMSGVVTLGSGFLNTVIKVDTVTTTTITTGKHLIHIDFDEISVSGGYWGYDGTNYGKFTLLRPELFNMQTTSDYDKKFYNNGSPETAVIPYELRGASQTELVTNGGFETYTGTQDDGTTDSFANWTVADEEGTVEATATVHSGSNAVKLVRTSGNTNSNIKIMEDFTVKGNKKCRLLFYTRGDGTNEGMWSLYDVTNSKYIKEYTATGVTGTTYTEVAYKFETDANTTSIRIQLTANDTTNLATIYYDDVSIIQIGNVFDLKPEGAGSNAWIGELGGETVIANTSGSPIARTDLRDGRSGVSTTEVQLKNSQRAITMLKGIIAIEKGGVSNSIALGTATGTYDLLDATTGALTANEEKYFEINSYSGSDRDLYTVAGASSVDIILIYEEVA